MILAGISISMLSGDNSILQKATEAKQTSERAEAKEQAQMDIMEYIADKTANHQDASLDDIKVKAILTGKSYVKDGQPGNESFITAKGEYEIPYSELYKSSIVPPITGEWTYEDNSYDTGTENEGTLSIGDLVTSTISDLANEKFYVLNINGNRVVLLAQKNVDTSTNEQANGDHPIAFDNDTNVYKDTGSTGIKKYVDNYVSRFISKGIHLLNVDIDEDGTVDNAKGRLIGRTELNNLSESGTFYAEDWIENKSFITETSFWLGSITEFSNNQVYTIIGVPIKNLNYINCNNSQYYGMRPIIEVEKSLIISE